MYGDFDDDCVGRDVAQAVISRSLTRIARIQF